VPLKFTEIETEKCGKSVTEFSFAAKSVFQNGGVGKIEFCNPDLTDAPAVLLNCRFIRVREKTRAEFVVAFDTEIDGRL